MFDRDGAVTAVVAAGMPSSCLQQQQQKQRGQQPDSPAIVMQEKQKAKVPQVFPGTERLYMLDTYLMSAGEIQVASLCGW